MNATHPQTVQLYRENVYIRPRSIPQDVWMIIKIAALCFLWYVVVCLAMVN